MELLDKAHGKHTQYKLKNKIFLFSFCIFLCVLSVGLFIPLPEKRICISAIHFPNNKKLFTFLSPALIMPRIEKNQFSISYTHSVNKGRIKDFYIVDSDNNLCLTKSRFVSYGAGMPETEDSPGQFFFVGDGYLEMRNINRIVPILTMAIGVTANHSIETEKGYYTLSEYFPKQTRVQIQYRRVTAMELLLNKSRHFQNRTDF